MTYEIKFKYLLLLNYLRSQILPLEISTRHYRGGGGVGFKIMTLHLE